jgi:hypothetical protein
VSGDKLKAKKNVEPESILKPNKLKTVIYESKRSNLFCYIYGYITVIYIIDKFLEVNWAAGDFDPREFFTQWSYESPRKFIYMRNKYKKQKFKANFQYL